MATFKDLRTFRPGKKRAGSRVGYTTSLLIRAFRKTMGFEIKFSGRAFPSWLISLRDSAVTPIRILPTS